MSNRDWRRYAALGGLALALVLGGQSVGQPAGKSPDRQAANEQKAAPQGAAAITKQGEAPRATCRGTQPGEEPALCYERRSTEAAEKQVDQAISANGWAKRQFWIAVAGTGAVVLSLLFSVAATVAALQSVRVAKIAAEDAARGSKSAADSVEVARGAMFAERRPWVGIFSIDTTRIEVGEEGATAAVVMVVKNTGGSPAHGLGIRARLIAEPRPEATVQDVVQRFGAPRHPDPDFTMCVFPGQEHEIKVDVVGRRENIDAHPILGGERRLIFTLCGFITYESGVGDARHFHATTFVYRVARHLNSHIMVKAEETFTLLTNGIQIVPWSQGWLAD